ncbi:hypothetical protein CN287_10545 [Bacillus cereus]|nr:hypothetical protein CN287_10545 [Bacillus cereus]
MAKIIKRTEIFLKSRKFGSLYVGICLAYIFVKMWAGSHAHQLKILRYPQNKKMSFFITN